MTPGIDSGSMPARQVGYPNVPGSARPSLFPADFISEAIDQTPRLVLTQLLGHQHAGVR